jgi:hypothetical protein
MGNHERFSHPEQIAYSSEGTRNAEGWFNYQVVYRGSIKTLPRITAAFFVLLLIGVISLAGIVATQWIGPVLAHGTNAQHADGKITQLGPGKDFTLVTATGQKMQFQCQNQCRASLGHLQRHLLEKAHTDVYFMQGENNTLIAIDVD